MISDKTQETLADIFANSERPDKISFRIDRTENRLVVEYEDIDEEWINELLSDTKQ